jgi:hypothetical protein
MGKFCVDVEVMYAIRGNRSMFQSARLGCLLNPGFTPSKAVATSLAFSSLKGGKY